MVDWVFCTLVADEERAHSNGSVKSIAVQSNGPVKSTAVVVMRDMLLGTLEHMDKLTGLGLGLGVAAQGQGLGHGVGQGLGAGLGLVTTAQGSGLEMSSLLRVMLAITQRLLPVPAPPSMPLSEIVSIYVSEPQTNTTTNPSTPTTTTTTNNNTNTKPLTVPSLGIGGLDHARTSLMAFHRSLRVLQGQGLDAQGQGLGTDTNTRNNHDKNDTNENVNDNDGDNDDDEFPSSTPPTPIAASTSIALQLLLDILPRACTQLSSPHLPHQVLALACVHACFERLALHSPAKVGG